YIFTIVSYLIGVFIFATIVGQVGNVITNRNANRLEFERLLDGAKTYMRHHKVPGGMKRRVLRWYDYSWSRGRIQGGGDINTALGLLPDKLKTELALHVNLSVLKKVTIFQECQPEFLHDLVLKMKAYIFTPGDSICRKGEVAREMFIIADGILEVLSETGKVLTTMKAGDFFGEIGILNLDGLNKRTADVRSVGYSELFSLSREDVLAAMKDYPEAQEILQTLGRKRLMEVRCVNKKHAKVAAEKESLSSNVQHAHVNVSSDQRTSIRFVDKIRTDVKDLTNAFRRSRWATGRRSNESIELQPLQNIRTPKGVLRRMPRVRSDEMTGDGDDNVNMKEKTTSPIGAGLPLLEKLHTMRDRQDREDRAPTMIPSPQTHVTSAVSPQQSILEGSEREVIGAGLPLLRRLKMLKAKEERLAKECHNKVQSQPLHSSSPTYSSISTIASLKSSATPSTSAAGSTPSASNKPPLKVSFREHMRSINMDRRTSATSTEREPRTKIELTDMKEQLISSTSFSSRHSKPSTLSIKDKIMQLRHVNQPKKIEEQPPDKLKPWNKLKLATVVNTTGSYTNLANSIHEEEFPSECEASPMLVEADEKASWTAVDEHKKKMKVDQVSASDSETKTKTDSLKNKVPKRKPRLLGIACERKVYETVDDLSPEYSDLTFVQKLNLLNERQKLAELESAMKTRSFSLDCTESNNATDFTEPLIRSHSEASGIARPKPIHNTTVPLIIQPCLQSPRSPESNETSQRRCLKTLLKQLLEEKNQQPLVGGDKDSLTDLKGLMRAPTVEGYVARHSRFQKSVTFNSTLSSPPHSAHSTQSTIQAVEERSLFPVLSAHNLDTMINNSNVISDQIDNSTNNLELDYQDGSYLSNDGSPKSTPFISRKLIKGSIEEQEYFGEVLLGIKHVIQSHLREVQVKFQDRFLSLELDVLQRDKVISQLQRRIQELEENPLTQQRRSGSPATSLKSGSSGSIDIPFMRGDSVDTIFASSPPSEYDRTRTKVMSKKRSSPRRTNIERSVEESSDQDSFHCQTPSEVLQLNRGIMMTDATGNIAEMSQSVVLNIEDSSRTSSSSCESQLEDDIDNVEEELHCDDWEIRMLAAELNRRESKKEEAKSSDSGSGPDKHSRMLRRRRRKDKSTESESEISGTDGKNDDENDHLARPRAASLDQHNLRRQTPKGVIKAMSFDRDKDRL
ncbi:Cyclic nucleotide-gated cation channel alpha-3, partial [Pseudolycoriella hygida]